MATIKDIKNHYNKQIPIIVNNSVQKSYEYNLEQEYGDLTDLKQQYEFSPHFSPDEMLNYGVFGGAYFKREDLDEFPKEWFKNYKISNTADPNLNYFKVNSGLSRSEWEKSGWIKGDDKHGWFIWYCRTYMGRRSEFDRYQCLRWKSYGRHLIQLKKNCNMSDYKCRPVQRQSLLHWSYNPFK